MSGVIHEPSDLKDVPAEHCSQCGLPTRYWITPHIPLCETCGRAMKAKLILEKLTTMAGDGRCSCSCVEPCPLDRRGSEVRCTRKELVDALSSCLFVKDSSESDRKIAKLEKVLQDSFSARQWMELRKERDFLEAQLKDGETITKWFRKTEEERRMLEADNDKLRHMLCSGATF